ncbi:MAG: beta-L-arabinofuranosidase domain-containing protein [Mangrovibacterium sp.]
MNYFPLSDVQLLDGEFKHIQDLTHQYLLSLEPDRLCSWFRREAGLTPKAPPYPGWESDFNYIIPGHILGFYLSSMSMMYETTGDTCILRRLKYTLKEMEECQNASGDGYLSAVGNGRLAYHKVLSGNYEVNLSGFAGVNEPTYIMNKITLGLYEVYTKCRLPMAKKILTGMGDWFGENIVDKLDEPALQKLLICEHGSLSESYVNIYKITGDPKYLEWAKRLNDQRVLIPAAEGKDFLPGLHANCQIQKFVGFESVYSFTGDRQYTDAALFFWKTLVKNYLWVIGGNSIHEHFFNKEEADNHVIKNGGPESCNTVNMLRLTEALYRDYALPEMLDFYERALLNHILAAYEPEQGMIAYMTKVQPGGFKTHGTKYNSFWCCTGTGFESPAKFQKMIYSYDDKSLYVNLFIPSSLSWKDKGIVIKQSTKIPDEEQTVLEIQTKVPKEFSLKIRHPYWVGKGEMTILINGKVYKTSYLGSQFAEIKRVWKSGDKVTIQLPMKLRVEPLTPSEKFISVSYGPVVLAAEFPSEDLKKTDYWDAGDNAGLRSSVRHNFPLEDFSWFIGSTQDITGKIVKVSSSPLVFNTTNASYPDSYSLVPFNRIHYSRYVLYFPHGPNAEDIVKRIETKKALDNATIDAVVMDCGLSEKQHRMESVSSGTGKDFGLSWRQAVNGGYFMYNLKSDPNKLQSLYLEFRVGESGEKTFDVLVDGQFLKTINHDKPDGKASDQLYSELIPIPEALIKGENNITIKFQAKPVNNSTGQIYDVRLIKTQQ